LIEVSSVTKKGQATIPKRLRQKYGIKDKVIFEENECGIVLKPIPSPSEMRGSLKNYFKGKTARQLLDEARKEEIAEDKKLEQRFRKIHV
jgi:AbrB family looped-hinge helix DNA binding protein